MRDELQQRLAAKEAEAEKLNQDEDYRLSQKLYNGLKAQPIFKTTMMYLLIVAWVSMLFLSTNKCLSY
jgi:hypothetical protein